MSVERAVRRPRSWESELREFRKGKDAFYQASEQLSQEGSEEALADEISGLLDRTQDNIDSRLIPGLDAGRLSPETLTNLARVLGSAPVSFLKEEKKMVAAPA